MSYTSLKLCRELYKLSGWETSYFHLDETKDGNAKWQRIRYDLGYLLRKLQNLQVLLEYQDITAWTADTYPRQVMFQMAKTPEDAVCKLAIECFKRGIIK